MHTGSWKKTHCACVCVCVRERERDRKNDLTNVSSSFACFVRISTRQKHFHTGFCQTERCLSADSGVGSRHNCNALGGVDVHDHHRTQARARSRQSLSRRRRSRRRGRTHTNNKNNTIDGRWRTESSKLASRRVGSGRVTPPAVSEPGDSTIFVQFIFLIGILVWSQSG